MKRKSLLVAMASMSLAAIGAGTVSTFAWFQATAEGVKVTANTPVSEGASITAQSITYSAEDYDATLDIVPYATFNAGKTLVYSQWDSVGNAWKHAFLKHDGTTEVWDEDMTDAQKAKLVPSSTDNTLTNYLVYQVQLSGSPTAEQQQGIAAQTLTVYFANNNGEVWVQAEAPANGYGTNAGSTISTTISIPDHWDGSTLTGVGYIIASVNGTDDAVQNGGDNQATLTVSTTNPNNP